MKMIGIAACWVALGMGFSAPLHSAEESAAKMGLPATATMAMRGIDAERIRAHVKFLSDDLLEGRGPGTRGGDLAANYIATQFALLGLKPAGDQGTFLQRVDFTGVKTQPATSASLLPGKGAPINLALGSDFVVGNQTQTEATDIDAPIVFVGYGIDSPEYGWNDFKGVDVKGKVLLVIVNEPPSKDPKFFNGEALTYYGRWTYKYEEAARKGAVAALIIHRTDLASYGWDVVKNSWSAEQVYLAGDKDPKLKAAAWIQLDVAKQIFTQSQLKLDEMIAEAGTRNFKARELPVHFKAHIVSEVRKFTSYNVLAELPGGGGQADQALIYSAHYDHLGIDPTLSGDKIYNGAVDNATGCGILIELAHAFATSSVKPPHPVLFAAVTAEEKGLLGSEYLGKHLPIAPAHVGLGLNFDAIPPRSAPESVTVAGAERTTFYPIVQRTAAAFQFDIQPDPEPGAGHYYRSDHFSLARAGVPAFSVNSGSKFKDHPAEWGKEQAEEYTSKRYHRPADEYSASMDFSNDAVIAQFGFALGWQMLSSKGSVQWNSGDEFEAKRLHSSK
jgi:Zn-dependent M28 family amino/carboxypeptidase